MRLDALASKIVRRAGLLSIIGLLLSLVLAAGLTRLVLDNNERAFFQPDDEIIERTDWLAERMGNSKDAMLLVYVPADGDILSPFSLSQLRTVTDEARQLPYVVDIHSLFDEQKLIAVPSDDPSRDWLAVIPVLQGTDLFSEEGLVALRRDLEAAPTILGRTIGRDFASAAITLQVELANPVEDDGLSRNERIDALQTSAEHLETLIVESEPGARVILVGSGLFEHASTQVLRNDVRQLFPVFGLLFLLALWGFYRSWIFAFSTAGVIGLVIAATAGALAWLGQALSTLSVSGLLLVGTLAVADIVHVANGYFSNRSAESNATAATEALRRYLVPIFATSLTTAIGACALFMTPARPIAVLAAVILVGVWLSLIITVLILPTILLRCARRELPIHDRLVKSVIRASCAARASPRVALGVTSLVAIAAAFGVSQMVVDDNLADWFDESTEFRQGMDLLDEQYLSLRTITLAVRVSDSDRDALLNTIDAIETGYFGDLQDGLSAATHGDWLSVATARAGWRARMADDDPRNGFRPDPAMLAPDLGKPSSRTLADSGLLTRLEPGVADWSVSYFDAGDTTTFGLLNEAEAIESAWSKVPGQESRQPRLQGIPLAFARTSAANFDGIAIGSLIAIVLVSLSMLLVFGSLRLAIIAFVPNILPLLITYGTWGAATGKLNMAAVGVFAIAFGTVVDDTIHLVMAFRKQRRAGLSTEAALDKALAGSGSAIVITTLLLAAGFFLLSLSDFNLTAQKAAMTGFAIVVALAFDLLVLPLLLQRWCGSAIEPFRTLHQV